MELRDIFKNLEELLGVEKNRNEYDSWKRKFEYNPWEIGRKYFIRTVTMHLTGELIAVGPQELVLKNAAWIADSGRFNEALRDIKKCNEVEPFLRPVIIGRGAIIDATEIDEVITEVK